MKTHPKFDSEDLPALPEELRNIYENVYRPTLLADPYNCDGFPHHALKGRLDDCRTLEINWNGISYRLVYRIYESPTPKRVLLISFEEHDPAYDKAKERTGRAR